MDTSWTIIETAFHPKYSKSFEGLFTQGSGYMHARGSFEEPLLADPQNVAYTRMPANVTSEKFPETKAKWGTYVPGIFGKHPLLRVEMVNLPFFLGLAPSVDGEKLDMELSQLEGYQRTLDLRTATLRRSVIWHTKSGATLQVLFERFFSAARPNLCAQRVTFNSDKVIMLTVDGGIDADIRTNGHDHLTRVQVAEAAQQCVRCQVQTDGGDEVTMLTQLQVENASWQFIGAARSGQQVATVSIPAGGQLVIEKRTAVTTSRDLSPTTCEAVLAGAADCSYEALFQEHAAVWAARWQRADVVIEGDTDSQRAMRASIYHLLRVHVPDERVAVDAKGYAGDAYFGRYFWDTEMYLLPFYLYTAPECARTLVGFRIHGLPGARDNARNYGYPGARYPWESDHLGHENCPCWQYADHEVHVTGDAVYGMAHYAKAVNDPTFLSKTAAEAIVETARYWVARSDKRPGDDYPSILGVMGPDEYTPISSNNNYTNRLAAHACGLAAAVGAQGGATKEECAQFAEYAARLPLLRRADGLVLQCEEFERYAEPRFADRWPDRNKTFAAQVSQEMLYRSKCLKQADVLMLMMLFPQEFSDAEIRQAWEYYVPYTTHDSSLSAGAHAILGCRLGLLEEAWSFWQMSSSIDLDLRHGGASEGIHIASSGANWQIAVFGFAGVMSAMGADTLTLNPKLPNAWTKLAFPFVWKGTPCYIEITKDACLVTNNGQENLTVTCAGQTVITSAGSTTIFSARQ